jgi:transcriptional regulator with XRE-family HTH domain
MATDDKRQQANESAAPASETIAQLIGRRLRHQREEAGLRQEDVAQMAGRFGFKWGRSSVAALEGGTRKLTIEELVMLPVILGEVGLPVDRLIQDTDVIAVNDGFALWGRSFRRQLLNRNERSALHKAEAAHVKEFEDVVFAEIPAPDEPYIGDYLNPDERLRNARFYLDRYAYVLLGMALWPQLDDVQARKAVARSVHPAEADRKVAAKIDADPLIVSLMAEALWGRSLVEERDARAESRGARHDARGLQGARGYVTRELTQELLDEWKSRPGPAWGYPEDRTKRDAYENWTRTLYMHYDDAVRLEQVVISLARLARQARGVPLEEFPDELRRIFDPTGESA